MHAAARNQPLRISLHVIRDPFVHLGRKANDFRRNVVDQHSTSDADLVQMLQKRRRRLAEALDLVEVLARLLHQRERLGLEELHRRDVNVAVGDHLSWRWRPTTLAWRRPSPSRVDTRGSTPKS